MNSFTIAVPSEQPGGLDSPVSAHFGHCPGYTLVDVTDGVATGARALPNVPHEQGGCMAPVNHLAGNGVQVLIAGGMGMRPLMGFAQVGVEVFYSEGAPTVGVAIEALLQGALRRFTAQNTCGGGDHQHEDTDHGCGSHGA